VTLQAAVDAGVALADLPVIELDQVAQRLDPIDVGVREAKLIQPASSTAAPDVINYTFHAQRLMHLRLQPGAPPGQLGPIADHLTQLTHWRWRHPRLRQPAQPQQISQQGGVTQIVLHPPVLIAGDPQRMRQMQPGVDNAGRSRPRPPVVSVRSPAPARASRR
jgi:hypothetical protein